MGNVLSGITDVRMPKMHFGTSTGHGWTSVSSVVTGTLASWKDDSTVGASLVGKYATSSAPTTMVAEEASAR